MHITYPNIAYHKISKFFRTMRRFTKSADDTTLKNQNNERKYDQGIYKSNLSQIPR